MMTNEFGYTTRIQFYIQDTDPSSVGVTHI
jgi:hypothetical protein